MNRLLTMTIALSFAATPALAAKASAGDAFKSDDERALYAYGYKIGQNVSNFSLSEPEVKVLAAGLRDAAAGKGSAVNMTVFLPKVGELLEKRAAAKAAAEKAKGRAFAEAFAKEDGVKPLSQDAGWIKSLKDGGGAQPSADDTVKVDYRGTLIDGSEFDSSYKRGEAASFPLKNVIPCWTNGVAQMKAGGKAKLVCPSSAAYGDHGHPPTIPGGATLVFEVELLEVVQSAAAKAGAKN